MATLFRTDFVYLTYYEDTYVFISNLRAIDLAHYLSTLLKVRVRKFRVLLGHFIKIIILLRIRALLCRLTLSQSPEISRITWPPCSKSKSGNPAYYLATLYKNSYTPKNSRITLPPYFVSESGTRAYYLATLYKNSYTLRILALLVHLTLSQSPEISRISWPLSNNSYTPMNSRITWPHFSGLISFNSRITRAPMNLYQT